MKKWTHRANFYRKTFCFLFVLLFYFFGNVFCVQAATFTITKKWEKDKPEMRPNTISVNIKQQNSVLLSGGTNASPNTSPLETKIKKIAGSGTANSDNTNIKAIKFATKEQYEAKKSSLTTANHIQEAGAVTYMWFESSTGTMYMYSTADNIFLPSAAGGVFRKMQELTDISGLSHLNTYYVTDMNRMFQDSTKIADFSPIAGWDVSNVQNMRFMFGTLDTANRPYVVDSVEAFRNWDVSSVLDFNQLFKGWANVKDISPLKNWDVSTATDMGQMFNHFGKLANLTDFSDLADWDVRRVTNFNMMLHNLASGAVRPVFNLRRGTWSGLDYSTSVAALPAITPTSPGNPIYSSHRIVDSGWVKNGDTWTNTFTCSDNGANYYVYENAVTDYTGSATIDSPITDVVDNVTIINTNNHYRAIEVTKIWNQDASAFRPSNIQLHLLKENGSTFTEVEVSDPSKWVKESDKWIYTFEVWDTAEYKVYEEPVTNYTSDALSSSAKAVVNDKVTITNTLIRNDLTLANKVTGNMGEVEKIFSYTVTLYDQNGNPLTGNVTVNNQNVSLTNGSFTTTLKHNQQIVVSNIPIVYQYKVVMNSENEYNTMYEINKQDGSQQTGSTLDTGMHSFDQNHVVIFYNGRNQAVPTGVFLQRLPFVVLMILGVMGYLFIRYSSMKENIIKK